MLYVDRFAPDSLCMNIHFLLIHRPNSRLIERFVGLQQSPIFERLEAHLYVSYHAVDEKECAHIDGCRRNDYLKFGQR